KIGLMDEQELKDKLDNYGLSDDQKTEMVDRCRMEINHDFTKQAINAVRQKYVKGGIDDITAQGELFKLNITQEWQSAYMDLWGIEKNDHASKVATKSELEAWYVEGVITQEVFLEHLHNLGFDEETIGWIAEDAAIKIHQKAEAMLKRQEAEQAKELKAEESALAKP